MSRSSRSTTEISPDIEELLQIGTRCRELRKEKDLLKESQSQSFDLIRKLELHVRSLSEARKEDKERIENLEKELMNCSQEIDYLQDQLNARNTEVNCLEDHVQSLESRLAGVEHLNGKVERLEEELTKSNSECFFLTQELENKEIKIQELNLCIEKLEESVSSTSLESQFEIESMKLDMMSMERRWLEAKKIQEEFVQEKARMSGLVQELEVQFLNAEYTIESLDTENKELREKLYASERNAKVFCQWIEKWLGNKDSLQLNDRLLSSELDSLPTNSSEMGTCGELLGPLLPKLASILSPDVDVKAKMEMMSHQILDYELLVKQLKDELKEEKLKAKDEAEDLAQEMAELRYQITGLLEEECKRRACVERVSLQRIAQLEAQVVKEQRKHLAVAGHLSEA